MKYLVDTHILLWSIIDPEKISNSVQKILLDEETFIFYSQVSLWEISLKYNLGKLKFTKGSPEQILKELEQSFYHCLNLKNEDLISFYRLPIEHKDPFDRILIWQCIQNHLVFISSDSMLKAYEKYGLKYVV
jgi:PIN domain nuclease of toxin-antitoxin system